MCCVRKLVIDKEQPGSDIFHSFVIQSKEWEEFCDKINGYLNTMNCYRLRLEILTALFFPLAILSFIIKCLAPPIGMILVFGMFLMKEKAKHTVRKIDEVCEEYSNKYKESNVSFTFDIQYPENLPAENRSNSRRSYELLKSKPNCFIKIEVLACSDDV